MLLLSEKNFLQAKIMYSCSSAVSSSHTRRLCQALKGPQLYSLSNGSFSADFLGRKVHLTNKAWLSTTAWSGKSNVNLRVSLETLAKRGGFKRIGRSESHRGSRCLELAVASALAFLTTASLVYLFPSQPSARKEARCEDGKGQNVKPYATMAMYAANPAAEFLEHASFGTHRKESAEAASLTESKRNGRDEPYDVSLYQKTSCCELLVKSHRSVFNIKSLDGTVSSTGFCASDQRRPRHHGRRILRCRRWSICSRF